MKRHLLKAIVLSAWLGAWSQEVTALEPIRFYAMGENDAGAAKGKEALETFDSLEIVENAGAGIGPLVDLTAFDGPTYVDGKDGADSFAVHFDGIVDYFTAPRVDPRDLAGAFGALSQAWVLPDSQGLGAAQVVWGLGTDNGGVGITENGFWELIAGGSAGSKTSTSAVEFDSWVHVAVLRGGNGASLYLDGSLAATNSGFWNVTGELTVGAGPNGDNPFHGALDEFAISLQSNDNPSFDQFSDIRYFGPDVISHVPGDVDQDGDADRDDYLIWSQNIGFDNTLGQGDLSTLFRGDVDQNGRVNFFDFDIILHEAAAAGITIAVPEPSVGILAIAMMAGFIYALIRRPLAGKVVISCACLAVAGWTNCSRGEVIVADDFFYAQPTKSLGPGGGFRNQDYGGGQNGTLGRWQSRWVSVGDGIITGADIVPEAFNLERDVYRGLTNNGLSANYLERAFDFRGLPDAPTLFFGVQMYSDTTPTGALIINDPGGPAQVSMGLASGGLTASLGELHDEIPDLDLSDGEVHQLVGKLEIDAIGNDERLTVWLDPSGIEESAESLSIEANVVSGLDDLTKALRLDHQVGGRLFWDNVVIGTTWEDAVNVEIPRVTLRADAESRELRLANRSDTDMDLNYYRIETASNTLIPSRWDSLVDQNRAGWLSHTANTARDQLTESNFASFSTLAAGQEWKLGTPYSDRNANQDLVIHVGTIEGLLNVGIVEYGPIVDPTISADFNGDGKITVADMDLLCMEISAGQNTSSFDLTNDGAVDGGDAAKFLADAKILPGDADFSGDVQFPDFVVLANNFGQNGKFSVGDFDCDGTVQFPDFVILANNFGQSFTAAAQTGSAAASTVPEPSGLLLLLSGGMLLYRLAFPRLAAVVPGRHHRGAGLVRCHERNSRTG
jgi:hypothetical protein